MDYRITGLSPEPFHELFALDDDALQARGMRRLIADAKPGFPCRVSLEDAQPGEALLLLPWTHLDAASPYRASGPIFVRVAAREQCVVRNAIPEQQRTRLLSVRGYDADGWMHDAEVVEGAQLEALIERLFADPRITFLHAHNARRGCYACRVDRD